MSFFDRLFGRAEPTQVSDSDADRPPCQICVHLDSWNVYHRRTREPIRPATHGGGSRTGPNNTWLEWSACYEHYQVVTAIYWLVITRKMDSPLYSEDIVRYMLQERNKYCDKPCCRDDDEDVDDSGD